MIEATITGFDIVSSIRDNASQALGVCSALLSILAFYPYARDTWRDRTHPQRASWLIWSVLSTIAFCSLWAEGKSASLWFVGIQSAGTVLIFLLSLRQGTGKLFRARDFYMIAMAALGLLLWFMTKDPVYALAFTIAISAVGGIATVLKSYHIPETENRLAWALLFTASLLCVASVGSVDWIFLSYPLYLCALYGAILCAITFGHNRKHRMNAVMHGRMVGDG